MKHLFGLAAFVLAISIGVGVTSYFRPRRSGPPPEPAPSPVPRPAPPDPTPQPPQRPQPAGDVSARVRQLTLDRQTRQCVAKLDLEPAPGAPAPKSVSVVIFLFVPNHGPVFASLPVAVAWPATGSSVEVRTPAPWVGSRSDPGSGYFARVVVTTGPARMDTSAVDTSLAGASPVLVAGDDRTR